MNKAVLIMKSKEDFNWVTVEDFSPFRYELFNKVGYSLLIGVPVLKKSIVYGVILLDKRTTGPGKIDRIFTGNNCVPQNMSTTGFHNVFKIIKGNPQ